MVSCLFHVLLLLPPPPFFSLSLFFPFPFIFISFVLLLLLLLYRLRLRLFPWVRRLARVVSGVGIFLFPVVLVFIIFSGPFLPPIFYFSLLFH